MNLYWNFMHHILFTIDQDINRYHINKLDTKHTQFDYFWISQFKVTQYSQTPDAKYDCCRNDTLLSKFDHVAVFSPQFSYDTIEV